MAQTDATTEPARMSDAAVQAKTGKTWPEWFALLDVAGAERLSHQEIVAWLREHYQLSGWWQQNVTVAYEQARGLRAKHQMPDGYQISVSKTMTTGVERVVQAWQDDALRVRWLPEAGITITSGSSLTTLRFAWIDGRSRVEVNLYPKGDAKTQVTVRQHKLPDAEAAARLKQFWSQALQQLHSLLSGPPATR